jgi:predicted GIY-YIG superfamily endonuclease
MPQWYLYIIQKGKGYYTGITTHLAKRLTQHGVEALYVECCDSRADAARREREIKGWTRAKKQSLWAPPARRAS